uniref:Coiled-coil domain containing 24 n=1 Tax=Astyanax mexicanus TaxID=7994 RepID=W5KY87_ASTMX
MESFRVQQSLWDMVKEYVPDSELVEVRAALGGGLIDLYLEIYSEVQMLERIWRNVQGGTPRTPRTPLADPPAVKELLRAELQLLLLNLRERAARLGRDGDEVVSRYNHRVVSYALAGRTGSPDSQCETAAPSSSPEPSLSRCDSRSSSRLSSRSSEDDIEALREKLNVTHIDEVVSNLKSIFTDECEALKEDVQFLQESVKLEYQKQREPELVEPTLTELKEERRIIQRDLNDQSLMSEASDKPKPRCCPASSRLKDLPTTHSTSLVPPGINHLYPNPSPPDISRPAHTIQPWHRTPLKLMQPLHSSPAGGQTHKLNPEPSCNSLTHQASTASTTVDHPLPLSTAATSTAVRRTYSCSMEPREEALQASRLTPSAGPDCRQLCGSSEAGTFIHSQQLGLRAKTAGTVALIPAPPAVQKVASRGQRANRQMALLQASSS